IHKQIYPATYNFKDDADSAEPSGWTSSNGADCTTTIISNLDGHRKVLKLVDGNAAGQAIIVSPTFTQGLDTTIEFWATKSSIAANTDLRMYVREGSTNVINLRWEDNDLDYWDGSAWNSIKDNFVVANTLHHIRLVLDDSANTFSCYIDGVLEKSGINTDTNSTSGVDNIRCFTSIGDTGFNGYFDAFGISTDASYAIGDNYFWRHYRDQDSGFESEDLGTSGTSIGFVDADLTGGSCTADIIAEFGEHKKVLRLDDQDAGDDANIRNSFSAGQASGIVEFLVKTTDTTKQTLMTLRNQGGIFALEFQIDNGNFEYNPSTGGPTTIVAAANDTWYHIKYEFECGAGAFKGLAADTYYVWIGNIRYGPFGFDIASTTLDSFLIKTLVGDSGYTSYIDAVSYLWTSGNEIADNRTLDYKAQSYDDITSNLSLAEVSDEAYLT
ncbi:hypothetical protein LCGC14_2685160, partial [marine sediment metagenome]